MHNFQTIFNGFYRICKEIYKKTNNHLNVSKDPVKPKMKDLKVISLSCRMEGPGIDSASLLWSKLPTADKNQLKNSIPARLNRRRKRLHVYISEIKSIVSQMLGSFSESKILDCITVQVIKLIREKTFRRFRQDLSPVPAKGYSSVNRGYCIGDKLHAVICENGVVQQNGITRGNTPDINFLKQAEFDTFKTKLFSEQANILKTVQLNIFENYQVKLKVPFRINQHGKLKCPIKYKNKRQLVDTFFAQLCDPMNLEERM